MHTAQVLVARRPASTAMLFGLFAASMLMSALLLFAIQPMFTKMVLPMLGGAPSVWNTGMLFFQMTLLAGYGYAHLSSKLLTWRRQAILHAALLSLAFLALPIAPLTGWLPPADEPPVYWLIGMFAASIGLPFFVLSANAPLLQRWFAGSGHPSATDPYFLYGASNLGSIAALVAYPTIVQPLLGLQEQSLAWTLGFTALSLLIGCCALSLRGQIREDRLGVPTLVPAAPDTAIGWRSRLQWIALALVPSSLMLGVTTHISTDVAAVPLLWVLPLIVYLSSFVLVFSRRPALKHAWMIKAMPYFVLLVALNLLGIGKDWLFSLLLHLSAFFVCAMVCHGELMKRRPAATGLTEFYLFMSFGGLLGGVFNALVAPALFTSVVEYPIALVAACMLLPKGSTIRREHRRWDYILPALLLAALALPALLPRYTSPAFGTLGNLAYLIGLTLLVFSFKAYPLRFGLGVAALIAGITAMADKQNLAHARSFFGVHRVESRQSGTQHVLYHGTTIHGAQLTDRASRDTLITYYGKAGPFGQIFDAYSGMSQRRNVALIGLGTGALACYRAPGEHWTLYEIDPAVVAIARDTRLFHFLADCGRDSPIVMGDARLSIRSAPDHGYGMLLLDAFSSDAVPIHLITFEAITTYLHKVAQDGVLVFHISNRHLDLAPVLAGIAADAGLSGLRQIYKPDRTRKLDNYAIASEVVVLARDESSLAPLAASGKWQRLDAVKPVRAWTDDYSNILGVMRNHRAVHPDSAPVSP